MNFMRNFICEAGYIAWAKRCGCLWIHQNGYHGYVVTWQFLRWTVMVIMAMWWLDSSCDGL